MKKRIVSIMGCGWLGYPLAKHLISKGYVVKGSSTSENKLTDLESEKIVPFLIKINDREIEGEIDSFLDCDVLILNIPPKRSPDVVDFYINQMSLLLQKIVVSPLKNLLFISTTSVYQNTNGYVNEGAEAKPTRPSGIATLSVENMLRNERSFQATILRFAGLIGPQRNPGRFLAGKRDIKGAKDPVNLIHLDDCVGIVSTIIDQNKWGELYNGCSPHHPSKKDFYTFAAEKTGLLLPEFLSEDSEGFKIVDGAKVTRELGYDYMHVNLFSSL